MQKTIEQLILELAEKLAVAQGFTFNPPNEHGATDRMSGAFIERARKEVAEQIEASTKQRST